MSKNVKNVEGVVQIFTFSTLKLLTNTFTVKQLHTSYTVMLSTLACYGALEIVGVVIIIIIIIIHTTLY